jgi:hypothetical protein
LFSHGGELVAEEESVAASTRNLPIYALSLTHADSEENPERAFHSYLLPDYMGFFYLGSLWPKPIHTPDPYHILYIFFRKKFFF